MTGPPERTASFMNSAAADEGAILVVDDGVDNLNLLSAILQQAGYRVRPALSGEAALKAIAASLPDLILLDIRMPGLDGYATCRRLKADARTRDIPVIFISAMRSSEDQIAAFDAGGVDYITKPFRAEEVLARARAHVHLQRIRRHLEEMVSTRTHELAESAAHLRQLSVFLQRVREEDRAHFARELHDELGQNLTALRIDFNELAGVLVASEPTVSARLAAIDQMLDSTVEAMRRICEDLRPGMLDDLGLEAALASYTKRFVAQFGVACDLALDRQDYGLDEPLSTAIFRIVQESLTNIARHAHASHAMVALQDRGAELLLTIADDGRGLPAELTGERRTYGLLGMRERVNMLGGRLAIDSAPGRGTHIEVSIPRIREAAT